MSPAPRIELDSPAPNTVDGRHIRAVVFQAARLEYIESTLAAADFAAAGRRALVVGGGRGLLAAGLAARGFDVVSIDPSARATEIAAALAREQGLDVVCRTAPAEDLGIEPQSFDLAYYADTFEITGDIDRVLDQAHAALKPGGVLMYDTVDRTAVSRLIYLLAFQRFPFARIMPPGRYAASRLRPPAELTEALRRHGFADTAICDLKPRSAAALVKAVVGRRNGTFDDAALPAIVEMTRVPGARPLVTYLGCARRAE